MDRVLRCLFLGVLVSSPALALETATVLGRVTDESGAILPGATVTAKNVDTGVTRSALTAPNGTYRIPALGPGPYELTAALKRFAAARRAGVTLNLGAEAVIDFRLELAGRSENLTVVADAPLVETTNATVQKTVSREQIEMLPISGRDVLDLARLSPGVTVDANFTGSRARANAFLIDGVDNAEDITGFSRQAFNLDGVREFQVLINTFNAEYGRADGGVISLVTRSGTNQLRGSAFFTYRDQRLVARGPLGFPEEPFRYSRIGGDIGGPVVRNRTHFFASFEYLDSQTLATRIDAPYPRPGASVSAATAAFLRANGVPPFPDAPEGTTEILSRDELTRRPRLMVRVDHAISQRQVLGLRFNYERRNNPSGFNGSVLDANGSTVYFRTAYGNLSHKWILRNSDLNELYVQVGETKGNWFAHFPTLTNIFIDEFSTGTPWLGGPTNFPQARTDRVIQVIDSFTAHLPDSWAGSHVVKLGGDLKVFRSEDFFDNNFRGSFFFRTVNDFLAGKPRRFNQNSGDSRLRQPNNSYGVYVQDDWSINRNLTLNLGVRYDYENGKTTALEDVPVGSAVCPLTETCGRAGPGISGDRNNVAPRFGFIWDPWGDGRTAVHGGAGIYYDQVILNVEGNARFTPPKVIGVQIDNPTFPDPFQGGARATLRPNITVIDPGLVTPSSVSASIGIKRELTPDLAIDATFVYKHGRDQVAIIGRNPIDPSTRQRPNPNFTGISLYTNAAEILYRGLLVEITKRMSDGYSFGVNYTLSKNEDDVQMFESFQDPRHPELNRGPSAWDRRHVLSGNVMARLGWGLELGTIFEYRSPRVLDVFVGGVDLNGDGITGDWPPGYSRNSVRQLSTEEANRLRKAYGRPQVEKFNYNPDFFNVDISLQKRVRLGGERRLRLTAELFNAFNWANWSPPNGNITAVAFGGYTTIEVPPRGLQLTAQVDF